MALHLVHRSTIQLPIKQAVRLLSSGKSQISIPNRIERGPTDILKALASTVKRDETAAHYKYNDDPFLIPTSNTKKREYALAKESGRQAARYFLDKYPHLFYRDDAEPKIPAFSYRDTFNDETVVDEDDLINCIQCRQIMNAYQVYKNCKKQKVSLSQDSLQSLLELLCFHNSKEGPDTEFLEQFWYHQREAMSEMKKTWLDGSLAEEVFDSMEKTPEAINTMICGFGRFNAVDKGFKLFEDSRAQGVVFDIETYNHVIKMVPFVRQSGDAKWELILDILRDMKSTNTTPNLGTFNEILDILSRINTWRHSKNMVLKTFCEMRKLGIEPSLATFNAILNTFVRDKTGGAAPEVLYSIIKHIQRKSFTIEHNRDVLFFKNAMAVASEGLNDLELGLQIHDLLLTGNNNRFLADSISESVYYRHLASLICASETMEGIMNFYDKYVPNIYVPEPRVVCDILAAIELHDGYEYLPRLFTDIVTFGYLSLEKVLPSLLQVLTKKMSNADLQKQFASIAQQITDALLRLDDRAMVGGSPSTSATSENFSLCMKVFINALDLAAANNILTILTEKQDHLPGLAVTEILQDFVDLCLQQKDIEKLLSCVKYATDIGNDNLNRYVGENLNQVPEDHPLRKRLEMLVPTVNGI